MPGDTLLIEAPDAFPAACAGSSTVARLGGDEFLVLVLRGLPKRESVVSK